MRKILPAFLVLLFASAACDNGERQYRQLHESFLTPPDEARPQVWWHWMNGNVTREGVRKDIEWMKRAGVGGFHVFDAEMDTPQIVEHRVEYMSDEFKEILAYATRLADSLGLETTIASSPGFSESGGPWVAPEDGMKRLSWREMDVTGGKVGSAPVNSEERIILPEPFSKASIFQNYPSREIHWGVRENGCSYELYRDIAVLAFPISADESGAGKPLKISASGGEVEAAALFDDDLQSLAVLAAAAPGQKRWIEFDYGRPQTIRSVQYCIDKFSAVQNPPQRLLASDDGRNWRSVTNLPQWMFVSHTIPFEAVTARYFRFEASDSRDGSPLNIRTLRLFGTPMGMRFEDVMGFWPNHVGEKSPGFDCGIASSSIIDLSDRLRPDGTLDWEVPEGEWRIMRFGWALTGKVNHPASPEATGLEVDKMDKEAVTRYYRDYLSNFSGAKIGAVLNDSFEAHGSTWSRGLDAEFKARCGYDLTKWLPAVAGYVINDSATTDAFTYDWIRTSGRLTVENHYDRLTEMLRPLKMRRISESHEGRHAFHCDGMEVKRSSDIPMSAMWVGSSHNPIFLGEADIRESASVAHIYGQKLVAAESFTAPGDAFYSFLPEDLKPTADLELASGVTRFVIHESAHQPSDDHVPGLGLGNYGQWFNRHETWAEQARPWMDYLARSSHLLMQGRNVADIAYLYGERYNVTYFANEGKPAIPDGYAYDYINAETLLTYSKIRNGRLVMPSGVSYSLLALDESTAEMSPQLLVRLGEFADAGVMICGNKPSVMAGLSGDKAAFGELAKRIWAKDNVMSCSIGKALERAGIAKDLFWDCGTRLRFVHRELDCGHVYWISNPSDKALTAAVSLRCSGLKPMLWRAEDGNEKPLSYTQTEERTDFSLTMDAHDAAFIVLIRKSRGNAAYTEPDSISGVGKHILEGPWKVSFNSPVYDSFEREFVNLKDLSLVEGDDEVKYFSGCASYVTTIEKGCFSMLDLGTVHGLAELIVNGVSRGIVWHAPFRFSLGELREGANEIEIRITTPWRNRLIGDFLRKDGNVRTYTANTAIRADSPLISSGLTGPVSVY